MDLVIGSLPRSGTFFVANTLRRLGFSVGHEWIFGPSGIHWERMPRENNKPSDMQIEVSGFITSEGCKYLSSNSIPFAILVRHPVDVVRSVLGRWGHDYFKDEPAHRGRVFGMSIVEYIAYLWYDHMKTMELIGSPMGIVPLEAPQLDDQLALVLQLSDFRVHGQSVGVAMISANRGSSTSDPDIACWDDLPHPVKTYAYRLGYGPTSGKVDRSIFYTSHDSGMLLP